MLKKKRYHFSELHFIIRIVLAKIHYASGQLKYQRKVKSRLSLFGNLKVPVTKMITAICAVREERIKTLKNKLRILLSFGHFWTIFGCFSDPSRTILLLLRTQGHLRT